MCFRLPEDDPNAEDSDGAGALDPSEESLDCQHNEHNHDTSPSDGTDELYKVSVELRTRRVKRVCYHRGKTNKLIALRASVAPSEPHARPRPVPVVTESSAPKRSTTPRVEEEKPP